MPYGGDFMMNGAAVPTSNGVPIPPQFANIIHPNPAYAGGGASGDAQGLGRRLLNAILAGGNFLGNVGQFAGGVSQLAQGPLAQQFLQGAFQNVGTRGGGVGGGRGAIGGGGGAATGTGVPFGTQAGNYGPLTGAILKHTPQTVLMNTSSPLHQVAKDFYLGPQRPAFNQVH